MLLTFDRIAVAQQTLRSVHANLQSTEELWLHIADDGSPQEYRDELLALARERYGANVSVTNSNRTGYGGNYNTGTQVLHSIVDIVLPLEDDWELTRPVNIDPIVKVLRDGIFQCVRMGNIGYTKELKCTWVWAEKLHWLELDPNSDERHVFAGHPRLETVDFERAIGPWPVGLEQGHTELEVTNHPEARLGVAWPISIIRPAGDAFVHIGGRKAGTDEVGSSVVMQEDA